MKNKQVMHIVQYVLYVESQLTLGYVGLRKFTVKNVMNPQENSCEIQRIIILICISNARVCQQRKEPAINYQVFNIFTDKASTRKPKPAKIIYGVDFMEIFEG